MLLNLLAMLHNDEVFGFKDKVYKDIQYDRCLLSDLIEMPNIVEAINMDYSDLTDFLGKNVKELVESSLNLNKDLKRELQFRYYSVLSIYSLKHPENVCNNSFFVDILQKSLTDVNTNGFDFFIASGILLSIIMSGNEASIQRIANDSRIFETMIGNIDRIEVYEILFVLTSTKSNTIVDFLCNIDFCTILINNIEKSHSIRMISILGNITSNSSINISILNVIFKSLGIFFGLLDKSDDISIDEAIFKFLHRFYSQLDVIRSCYCDSDSYTVQTFISDAESCFQTNFDKLVSYLTSDKKFGRNKGNLLDLIRAIIQRCSTGFGFLNIINDYLFEQMFSNPYLTFLHNHFLNILKLSVKIGFCIDEFSARNNVKQRIAECLNNKENVSASYWIHLHEISELIIENTNAYLSFEIGENVTEPDEIKCLSSDYSDEEVYSLSPEYSSHKFLDLEEEQASPSKCMKRKSKCFSPRLRINDDLVDKLEEMELGIYETNAEENSKTVIIEISDVHDRLTNSEIMESSDNLKHYSYSSIDDEKSSNSEIQPQNKDDTAWQDYVNNEYKRTTEILSKQYGGYVPKRYDNFTKCDM